MNILSSYLKRSGISQIEFARQVGIHPSVASRYISGETRPGIDTAFLIQRLTNGEVPAESWAKANEAAS